MSKIKGNSMFFYIAVTFFLMNNALVCMKEEVQKAVTLKLLKHWQTYKHKDSIWDLSWDSSAQHLASTSNSRELNVWDVQKGKELRSAKGYTCATFCPKEYLLAAASYREFDEPSIALQTQEWFDVQWFDFGLSNIFKVEWHPFDKGKMAILSGGCDDNYLPVTNINVVAFNKEHKKIKSYEHGLTINNKKFCSDISWNSDGTQLALGTGFPEAYLEIWDCLSKTQTSRFKIEDAAIEVRWHPKEDLIFIGTVSSYVLNSKTGIKVYSLPNISRSYAEWSPDGDFLAVNSKENRLLLLEARTGKVIDDYESDVCAIAWSPDSKKLATTTHNGIMSIWEVIK